MSEELDVLKLVCKRLNDTNISYMITGSIALTFYAVPRMTRDIDIVIELQQKDVERIFKMFKDDFYIDGYSLKEAVLHQGMFNIINNRNFVKVDFIIDKKTEFQISEFNRKRKITVDEVEINVISPEDLVISKLLWAKDSLSEIQLKDISNILEDVEDIDCSYIEQWLTKLDLADIYLKVKE